MNNKKFIFILLNLISILISIFPHTLTSQIKLNSNKHSFSLEEFKVSKVDTNMQNFPFRLGTEFGIANSFNNQGGVFLGFLGFMDINLFRKTCYLKFEFGKLFEPANGNKYLYASLGINYKISVFKKNQFFINGSFFVIGGNSGEGPSAALGAFLSFRYLYAFSKYFGLVSSIRYPFGAFNSFLISTGIQFFTD